MKFTRHKISHFKVKSSAAEYGHILCQHIWLEHLPHPEQNSLSVKQVTSRPCAPTLGIPILNEIQRVAVCVYLSLCTSPELA